MSGDAIAIGVVVVLAVLVWIARRDGSGVTAHQWYIAGDQEQVARRLATAEPVLQISLSTALGQYSKALDYARAIEGLLDPEHDQPNHFMAVARLNAIEALVELGRIDEALQLLERGEWPDLYLTEGRRAALAWTLSLAGRNEEALRVLDGAAPEVLGDYAAETYLVRALVLLNLRRPSAGPAIEQVRPWVRRASTETKPAAPRSPMARDERQAPRSANCLSRGARSQVEGAGRSELPVARRRLLRSQRTRARARVLGTRSSARP